MTTAIVTGAAGFIGSHLCAELNRQDVKVVPVDRKYGIDVSWPDEVRGLPPVDVVYHLAAFTGVRKSVKDPLTCIRWNVDGTVNMLGWAVEKRIKQFVFTSSSSIYGGGPTPFTESQRPHPMSPYAASKVAGEALCEAYHKLYGLNVAILRPFTVYGPNGRRDMAVRRFIEAMQEDRPLTVYGYGLQQRDFTYVDDVVDALIEAATWAGFYVVNVGAGEPRSLEELIGLLEGMLGVKAEINLEAQNPADVPITHAATAWIKQLMDWQPTPLEDGLRLTLEV